MTTTHVRISAALGIAVGLAALLSPSPAAQQPQAKPPVFRANLSIVSVDVIVRDRDGKVVRGLTAADFELIEDGRAQDVRTFAFEEIKLSLIHI